MTTVMRLLFWGGLSLLFCLWVDEGASAAPLDFEVMTQNLYAGADATPVLTNPTPTTIAAAFQSVLANNFPARAGAIASEAASAGGPLLIGLQEAEIIGAPGGVTLDYAQILLNALASRGLNYTEAGMRAGFRIAAQGYSLPTRRWCLPAPVFPALPLPGLKRTPLRTTQAYPHP